MPTQFLTGVFKIHNPSQWRKKVLSGTIAEYTIQFRSLLEWAKQNESWLEENGCDRRGKYTEQSLKKLIPSPNQANLASALKDSLVSHLASSLASYFSLKNGNSQESTGFPSVALSNKANYEKSLDQFVSIYLENSLVTTKEQAEVDENLARYNFIRLSKEKTLPVIFVRRRDFSLLVDTRQERYFCYLKLTPSGSDLNLQKTINGNNLVDVSTGEVFSKRAGCGVLFPLEIGDGWLKERFIDNSMEQVATPKAAKLVKDKGEYYLHVSFAFDCPEPYEPETYLGVDRGVFFTAAYAVVDTDGQVVMATHRNDGFRDSRVSAGKRVRKKQQKGQRVTAKDYRGKYLDGILHTIANELIEVALSNRSMIVMENLNIQVRGKFFKSAWKKLHWIVEYKARLAGVPFKKDGIWAAWTSKLCVNCGEEANRPQRDTVCCPHCGYEGHADELASINIARRAMYRKKDWGGTDKKPGDWRAFHRSFANVATFGAKIDLREMEVAYRYS